MGNGKNGSYYYCIVGDYKQGSIMWAHNTSLDLLTQGGVLLFVAFYGIVVNSIKKLFKARVFIENGHIRMLLQELWRRNSWLIMQLANYEIINSIVSTA